MRRAIVLAAVVLLALGTIAQPRPALAQLGLDAEYVSPDGSFKFDYPSAWAVQPGSVLEPVAVQGGSVILHVYGPESLSALSLGTLTQPIDLALAYRSLTRDQTQADTAPFTISLGERSAACLDLLDASGKPRLLVAVPFLDGRLGLIEVVTAGPALVGMDQDTALAIAASFDLPTGASQTGLRQYAADWQSAIRELEQTGIIPSGGSLIFTRDLVPFSGTGAFFEPLAETLPTRDVVVSGWLIFTPGGGEGYESCALGARVTLPEGRIDAYLEVGFRNSGTLFYADHTGSGAAPVSEELAFGPVAGLPYHVLLIVHGDRLSVLRQRAARLSGRGGGKSQRRLRRELRRAERGRELHGQRPVGLRHSGHHARRVRDRGAYPGQPAQRAGRRPRDSRPTACGQYPARHRPTPGRGGLPLVAAPGRLLGAGGRRPGRGRLRAPAGYRVLTRRPDS